jgi:hypothetical protein
LIYIDEVKKSAVLKWIFEHKSAIVIKNDFMDAEEIVFVDSDQKIYWNHWCPRENITYSRKELKVDEAWEYAVKYAAEWIKKAFTALKIDL